MVRGCALIDSRLDTAKICSDGRVHVDHAQLPAVFGGEKTFSHGLGQNRKSSMRANVFRFATESACPFRANRRHRACTPLANFLSEDLAFTRKGQSETNSSCWRSLRPPLEAVLAYVADE